MSLQPQAEGSTASTTTNTQRVNQGLCEKCLRTPWHNLPLEDEPAHRHQPSRTALEVSAKTCRLCRLILKVVSSQIDRPRNQRYGKGFWRNFMYRDCIVEDGQPRKAMLMRDLGSCCPSKREDYFENDLEDQSHLINVSNFSGGYFKDREMSGYRLAVLGTADIVTAPTGMTNSEREHVAKSQMPEVETLQIGTSETDSPVWLYMNLWAYKGFDEPAESVQPRLMGIGARLAKSASMFEALDAEKHLAYFRGSQIGLCTNDESKYKDVIPGRLRELDSSSGVALQRLKKWLSECSLSHKWCQRPALSTLLPTRVLDVTISERSVAVLEAQGLRGRYIALSHTWGSSPRLMLTSETRPDLTSEIAISYLPKTFKDAITLTRELGLRYLWIDCLCIVQDDPEDWEREAANMGQVYRNAYLTISAATSTDSYLGCFPKRTENTYVSPATISMGYNKPRDTDGASIEYFTLEDTTAHTLRTIGTFYFFEEWLPGSMQCRIQKAEIGAFGKQYDPIATAPLSNRGWTLQERFLSRRIIHYAEDQMFYECESGILSEDGFVFPNYSFNFVSLVAKQRVKHNEHGLPSEGSASFDPGIISLKGIRWDGGWIGLVEEYCRRQLTVPDDKLTAVAGLARSIAADTGEQYFAGVWSTHLYEDLCWRVFVREERQEYDLTTHRVRPMKGAVLGSVQRPRKYRAPSWSWASLDAPISFIPLSYPQLVAKARNIYVTPAGKDKFGRVKDGFLDIEAPLFQVHLYTPKLPFDRHGIPIYIDFGDERAKCTGSAFLDDDTTTLPSHCYALFLDPATAILVRGNGVIPERLRGAFGNRKLNAFDGEMLDSITLRELVRKNPSMKGVSAQGLTQVERIGLAIFHLTRGSKTSDGFPLEENEPQPEPTLVSPDEFDPALVELKKGAESWGPVKAEDTKVYITVV